MTKNKLIFETNYFYFSLKRCLYCEKNRFDFYNLMKRLKFEKFNFIGIHGMKGERGAQVCHCP